MKNMKQSYFCKVKHNWDSSWPEINTFAVKRLNVIQDMARRLMPISAGLYGCLFYHDLCSARFMKLFCLGIYLGKLTLTQFGLVTVYPKKYAHGFCFAVLCCGYTLTDFPISIRLTSLALLQSNDCPSASKATLMNMDKYFMWIHYERLHNHNKAKHNKTVCIFLGIYCRYRYIMLQCHLYSGGECMWHICTFFMSHCTGRD